MMINTKSTTTSSKMMMLALVAFVAASAVLMVSGESSDGLEQDMDRSRRLSGGYSSSFCARTLADCCTPNEEGLYPDCRCPKRRKGGLDEPLCLFGFCTGSYTQICSECTTRCAAGGDLAPCDE
mmetsp:Transcript_48377/g.117134  ORF Transcript_48377/g.117134 Transcript_48377/m.117134 type:complete len:124 (-) Transcript_48377:182-553(-)